MQAGRELALWSTHENHKVAINQNGHVLLFFYKLHLLLFITLTARGPRWQNSWHHGKTVSIYINSFLVYLWQWGDVVNRKTVCGHKVNSAMTSTYCAKYPLASWWISPTVLWSQWKAKREILFWTLINHHIIMKYIEWILFIHSILHIVNSWVWSKYFPQRTLDPCLADWLLWP